MLNNVISKNVKETFFVKLFIYILIIIFTSIVDTNDDLNLVNMK